MFSLQYLTSSFIAFAQNAFVIQRYSSLKIVKVQIAIFIIVFWLDAERSFFYLPYQVILTYLPWIWSIINVDEFIFNVQLLELAVDFYS